MNNENTFSILMRNVADRIASVRNHKIILDADVALLYGVETKRINEAVRNNPDKFPSTYMFQLSKDEVEILWTKISSTNYSAKSRSLPYAFTEKGLYMLATILKSKTAINTTFAIIETFAAVRELKRELVELHKEGDKEEKHSKMQHFGEILTNIVMPDLELRVCRLFYIRYPQICETVSHNLSFSHIREILSIADPMERFFYELECIKGTWNRISQKPRLV